MTEEAGERFAGMTVLDAREAVVEALRAEGRIARTEPYVHSVPHSQRSGERIEPLISLQWFMAMDELAKPAIEVVRNGRVQIHPEGQERRYFEWMENIRPWCISRQLWWGHQIPVWYRGDDERYVGMEPPEGDGWERDPDVLDTWFSSGIWPFVTLGWPDQTAELKAFYPTDVLSTARDILFLWVARMIMMGLEFVGDIPFDRVYVHSIIQAPDGRRMSKSLGTGIDPLDLIGGGPRPPVFEQGGEFPAYGADAVRFGLLAMSSTQDVRFNEEKIAQGRQLANKLWNAARLVLLRVPEDLTVPETAPPPQTIEDAWILSRLQGAKADVARSIDAFEFHHAALGLYDFVYGELCDWYLEMIKPRLYEDDNRAVAALALHVLAETLGARPPDHPVRHRGDLVAHARRGRPADGPPLPGGRRRAARRGGRARGRARDRRDAGAARLARPRRRRRRQARPRPARGARLRPHRRPRRAARARRVVGRRRRAGRDRRRPRRQHRRARVRGGRRRRRRRTRERPEGEARGGDRPRRGKAREPGLRREGPGGRRRGRARRSSSDSNRSWRSSRVTAPWRLEDAEAHLLSLELFGMRFGLDRMRRLLTALGSPQERFAAIHVVGTNGKSSTVRMCAALLEAHGVRTGAFLSPHLTTFAERIRIGDADLDPDAFGAAVQRAAAAAAKVDRTLEPGDRVTQFELVTAAAFDELARRGVEVAVVEAGLGGRHDATNVLAAPVCVLTNVGLEHTRWLGPTVRDIAREKLAVVPAGATLVTGPLEPEVARARARDRRAASSPPSRSSRPLLRLPGHELRGRARPPPARTSASSTRGSSPRSRAACGCRGGCRWWPTRR